ncbi:MAG: hypothetical protein AB7U20_21175 [Planctomycetaceae bacterium]
MSEYQYVEFRAVDRPLTDAELDFANQQSTRAEVSRWSLRNEYHYGSFRGDVQGPRRKRMTRSARLQSAVSWLAREAGNNVLRAYCRQFGVDWRCAAIELKELGVRLDANYLMEREAAERRLVDSRKRKREAAHREDPSKRWPAYSTPWDAYLAEDYAALHVMECELITPECEQDQR